MGYTRLDTTTSKSLVAAHRRFRVLKLFSIKNDYSVTSPSGHFWFHIGVFFTFNWCTYVSIWISSCNICAFIFLFQEELLLGLCLDHMLCCGVDLSCTLWPAEARYCQPCAVTPLMYRALLQHPVSSLKKTTVVFPSLYVSTKENTMHKLCVMSFTWQCVCILMRYPNNVWNYLRSLDSCSFMKTIVVS